MALAVVDVRLTAARAWDIQHNLTRSDKRVYTESNFATAPVRLKLL